MHAQIEALQSISTEHGFLLYTIVGTFLQAWALSQHGQAEEVITQMRQGLATFQAIGAELLQPYRLLLLAEGYGKGGQPEEGLKELAGSLAMMQKNKECWWEAELYRLKGELTLQQFQASGSTFQVPPQRSHAAAQHSPGSHHSLKKLRETVPLMLQVVQALQVTPRVGLFQSSILIVSFHLFDAGHAIPAGNRKDLGLDLTELAFQNTAYPLLHQVFFGDAKLSSHRVKYLICLWGHRFPFALQKI